jgi:hypothetical protein
LLAPSNSSIEVGRTLGARRCVPDAFGGGGECTWSPFTTENNPRANVNLLRANPKYFLTSR